MIFHRVLILPIGTEIGLEIYRALRYSKHFEVFGISSDNNNHGRFVCKNYIEENLPLFKNSNFWQQLLNVVKKYKIDFIYPASPLLFDVLYCMPNKKLKQKIILPNFETVRICRSKRKTYLQFLQSLEFEVPGGIAFKEDFKYPIFLKPEFGQGSLNSFIINSKEEFDFYIKKIEHPFPVEYIDGPEYTVDCFTNRHGELRFVGARQRNRIKNGISVNTSIVDNKRFKPIAEMINATLEMRGGWFFQVKGNEKLYLLEIEPRIAGTSGIWRQVGVNLPLLTLYDRLKRDVQIEQLDLNIELDRAYKARFKVKLEFDHVYIDFDDTILIDNSVNTKLMDFLYQCKNNNKQVYLLTRNAGVHELLERHLICKGLFNNIGIVEANLKKSDYINRFPSIFIDDSFGERREVKKNIGIQVFDLDAVECLREG